MAYTIKQNKGTKRFYFSTKGEPNAKRGSGGGSFQTKQDAQDWMDNKVTIAELRAKGRYK
jgi:hypothetical protein